MLGTALWITPWTVACIGVPASKATSPSNITTCPGRMVRTKDGLLDDFEDGNTRLAAIGDRGGYWFKSADSSGSYFGPDPIGPVEKDGSLAIYAVGATASGADAWGALLGVSFKTQGFYDASQYAGISFRAKAGAKSVKKVRFEVADVNTHPNGNVCTDCWNHFGTEVILTTDWQEHQITFASLEQEPYWGNPRPGSATPSEIYSMNWEMKGGAPFQFWVDDITFLACE